MKFTFNKYPDKYSYEYRSRNTQNPYYSIGNTFFFFPNKNYFIFINI
uniref:Uncharacterized protein n=1 Tax=Cryptosporidium parvum TaxID=5807 RepID=F0X5T2_CRYPV